MSRLTFDDLTPDDMPEPFYDNCGDRADAHRDSLGDLVPCGQQTSSRPWGAHPSADQRASSENVAVAMRRDTIRGRE